jgi:hypothetical protein
MSDLNSDIRKLHSMKDPSVFKEEVILILLALLERIEVLELK